MDDRALLLIKEASRIAIQINNDRLCGIVPESDLTVRLTEVIDMLEAVVDMDAFNNKYADVLLPVMTRLADR